MKCSICGMRIEYGEAYGVALQPGENWDSEKGRKYYHLECARNERRREESQDS